MESTFTPDVVGLLAAVIAVVLALQVLLIAGWFAAKGLSRVANAERQRWARRRTPHHSQLTLR